MGAMTPGTLVLLGFLTLLYGVLVGGTWTRRNTEKLWDTVSTMIFIVVAAAATVNLVIVGARQNEAFEKAKNRLDCVAVQLQAVQSGTFPPACEVKWDQ